MKSIVQNIGRLINYLLCKLNLKLTRINTLNDHHDSFSASEKDAIFIFQMGKVASSTIRSSLKLGGHYVFHSHWLSDITYSQLEYIFNNDYAPQAYVASNLRNISHSKIIRHEISTNYQNNLNKIKLITLTRDPIHYLVSSFFQNLYSFHGYYIKKKYNALNVNTIKQHFFDCIDAYLKIYDIDRILNEDDFKENWKGYKDADVRSFLFYCRWPLIWFDRELNNFFNFDIYSNNFDKNLGFGLYKKNGMSILIIKFENFSAVAKDQISTLVNDSEFTFTNQNFSPDKEYNNIYKEFTSDLVLPKQFIDHQYSSKYMNYFYTKDEIDKFRNKWTTSMKTL